MTSAVRKGYRRLGDLCRTYAGGTPSRSDPSNFGGGIAWVKSGEVVGMVSRTEETLSPKGLDSSSARWVEPGALLVAMYGAGLTAGQVATLAVRATTNQAVLALVPHDSSEAQYLRYAFEAVVPDLLGRKQGSGQPNLNANIIRRAVLPWPDAPVRRAVEQVLSRLDSLSADMRSAIDANRRLRLGLAQQLLTGKKRFPEFRARPWPEVRLGDHVKSVQRKNAAGCVRVLTASGEHGLVDQREFFNRRVAAADVSGYYLLRRGEFAYNRSAMNGYPYGATKRLDAHDEGVLSTLYLCFAIGGDKLDSDFLRHLFDSGLLNKQLRRIVRVGARAHGLLNVSDSDFFDLSIPFPALDEQRAIAGLIDGLEREIDLLSEQRDLYTRYKRGLMARLLSGEIKVPA